MLYGQQFFQSMESRDSVLVFTCRCIDFVCLSDEDFFSRKAFLDRFLRQINSKGVKAPYNFTVFEASECLTPVTVMG